MKRPENKAMTYLIGAKVLCCGLLVLWLAGIISLGAVAAALSGNAVILAAVAGAVLVGTGAVWRHRRRRPACAQSAPATPAAPAGETAR